VQGSSRRMAKRFSTTDFPITAVAGEYHKYRIWGIKNSKWNESCGRLLDLKNEQHPKHEDAIKHFGEKVSAYIGSRFSKKFPIVIALVPGHSKNTLSAGLRAIVGKQIRPAFNVVNTQSPLRRHTDAEKRANGGDRSIESVVSTVSVTKGVITTGCTVVLLDDVTTTGNSLRACAQLLIDAGAAQVICIALMNTVHD
jgi:hypothetical protein